ncbi:MAG: membrane dipeptidase, partial [Bacillota bacterium]|nr:membrane dipeptidase [Bacillota bacterium]
MQVFDLHCDTLKRSLDTGIPLEKNDFHISFERASCFENWIQCMAIFIPDEMRGNEAFSFFIQASKHLSSEIKKSNQNINLINNFNNIDIKKNNIVFTVEGGAALAGKLENVKLLSEHGVRAMTLTWNGENEIGSGVCVENPRGITSFGCDVIHEMEKYGIAVDVSHASEKLFYDVADIA